MKRKVLSVQATSMGHKTYGNLIRHFSSECESLNISSVWYDERRQFGDRVIRRLSEMSIPFAGEQNLDCRRARAEWATGRMSRNLTRRMLIDASFDAIHFHTQVQAFCSTSIMQKVPSVVSIDMTAYQVAREYKSGPSWTFTPNILMERRVFEAASHIITFSDWARNSVLSDHQISPDRVTTVHPGANLSLICGSDVVLEKKLRILFVGNDFKRKGGGDLIDVFTIGGGGSAELHIMTNDAINFDHPDIKLYKGIKAYTQEWHDIFRNADVLVLPSYREAYGLVLQEAAAHGLALIGSNVGGIPEMIINGLNGFIIVPGDQSALADALRRLSEDNELLRNMRLASRDLAVKKFDAKANFQRFFEILNSAASCFSGVL